MRPNAPKVMKDAQRARLTIEQSVRRFARAHRYTSGTELHAGAKAVVVAIHEAWRESERGPKLERTLAMCRAVDALRFDLQLAQEIGAFRSFAEFEAILRIVDEVGRQCGGLRKRLESAGQNARGAKPSMQRAPTLSARAASPSGATP